MIELLVTSYMFLLLSKFARTPKNMELDMHTVHCCFLSFIIQNNVLASGYSAELLFRLF